VNVHAYIKMQLGECLQYQTYLITQAFIELLRQAHIKHSSN